MPVIFADPSELYAIADRIGRHAEAVRSNARMLAAALAHDRWRGIAAEAFAAQSRSVLRDTWACARRLDDAADALRRHAGRVHGALRVLTRTWDDVEGWGTAIVGGVGGFLVDDDGLLDAAITDARAAR